MVRSLRGNVPALRARARAVNNDSANEYLTRVYREGYSL